MEGIRGNARKLIILDLDDTLWGGVVGDLGLENINLGGHDPVGEAYRDFQRGLKALTHRGVLLAIVSKNDESMALDVIKKHPEMILKLKDFAGWRINWEDKAQNIVDLVKELNLGLQSTVFIDDNPVERARVKDVLPEVLVPEWPKDKMLYPSMLLNLSCFDSPLITREDVKRSAIYASERKRVSLQKEIQSLDEWLKKLKIKVHIEELDQKNLQRAVQLLNKTNQMNLSTRRMAEAELWEWAGRANHKLWTIRVSDKFGDSGLTGIVSLAIENVEIGQITDFILSCRVMGRKIEETMLGIALQYARAKKLEKVYAQYIPTPKNKPCLEFFERSRLCHKKENHRFVFDLSQGHRMPELIQIGGDSYAQ